MNNIHIKKMNYKIIIVFCSFFIFKLSIAQTLKTYNGPFENGTAIYTYYENSNDERIYHGKFTYKYKYNNIFKLNKTCVISCNFINNKLNGKLFYKYDETYENQTTTYTIEGDIVNEQKNGIWIIGKNIIEFHNDTIIGTPKISYRNGSTKIYFDDKGNPIKNWKIDSENKIEKMLNFKDGFLTKYVERDKQTGHVNKYYNVDSIINQPYEIKTVNFKKIIKNKGFDENDDIIKNKGFDKNDDITFKYIEYKGKYFLVLDVEGEIETKINFEFSNEQNAICNFIHDKRHSSYIENSLKEFYYIDIYPESKSHLSLTFNDSDKGIRLLADRRISPYILKNCNYLLEVDEESKKLFNKEKENTLKYFDSIRVAKEELQKIENLAKRKIQEAIFKEKIQLAINQKHKVYDYKNKHLYNIATKYCEKATECYRISLTNANSNDSIFVKKVIDSLDNLTSELKVLHDSQFEVYNNIFFQYDNIEKKYDDAFAYNFDLRYGQRKNKFDIGNIIESIITEKHPKFLTSFKRCIAQFNDSVNYYEKQLNDIKPLRFDEIRPNFTRGFGSTRQDELTDIYNFNIILNLILKQKYTVLLSNYISFLSTIYYPNPDFDYSASYQPNMPLRKLNKKAIKLLKDEDTVETIINNIKTLKKNE